MTRFPKRLVAGAVVTAAAGLTLGAISLVGLGLAISGFNVWRRGKGPPREQTRVQTSSLTPGPILRSGPSAEQNARLQHIHDTFAEIDGLTFEKRMDGLLRDMNPDSELDLWEWRDGRQTRPRKAL